jgi:hypothetical protein
MPIVNITLVAIGQGVPVPMTWRPENAAQTGGEKLLFDERELRNRSSSET